MSYAFDVPDVDPRPRRRQIGGVARAEKRCIVHYRLR